MCLSNNWGAQDIRWELEAFGGGTRLEWTYAGFAINIVSALIAHLSVGDGPDAWGWAAATGVLWGLSYFLWRGIQAKPASA